MKRLASDGRGVLSRRMFGSDDSDVDGGNGRQSGGLGKNIKMKTKRRGEVKEERACWPFWAFSFRP